MRDIGVSIIKKDNYAKKQHHIFFCDKIDFSPNQL